MSLPPLLVLLLSKIIQLVINTPYQHTFDLIQAVVVGGCVVVVSLSSPHIPMYDGP